jgi:hypothetical protein
MYLQVHIYLDDEHHISWVYNLQAEAEHLLEASGDSIEGTGYEVYGRRRDWFVSNPSPKAKLILDQLLKSQGVRYTIEELPEPDGKRDDQSGS